MEGPVARVSVQDEGPGLPPVEQERIWERFHRVRGVEVQTGSGIGLGLGLYISKPIITWHGGGVGVDSSPGQGSTFWFTWPLDHRQCCYSRICGSARRLLTYSSYHLS